MADSLPLNPFKPGFGRPPSYMGHRPEVEHPLLEILERLRSGEPDNHLAFLYGPRGNGKTVLLRWLRAEANRKDESLPIAFVRLIPEHLETSERLCRQVVNTLEGTPGLRDHVSVDLKTGIPGLFKLRLNDSGREDPVLGLSDWLDRDGYPVLFAVDEAHEADPAMLGRFLNAVQLAGEHRPVAAVLAGTPGLQDTLRSSRASFRDRGRNLAVGLLPEPEAQAALRQPFLENDIPVDDGAIAALAREADDYPYFLQLYGEAAWDAMRASGSERLESEHVPKAIQATHTSRRRYYGNRYDEFMKAGALRLARDVALAFRGADSAMTNDGINRLLARHPGDPAEMRALLNAKGYIWRDDDDHWSPGIPSLMDYMIEATAADTARSPRTPASGTLDVPMASKEGRA